MYKKFILFCIAQNSIVQVYNLHIHLPVGRHWVISNLGVIMNEAAINIHVQVLVYTDVG